MYSHIWLYIGVYRPLTLICWGWVLYIFLERGRAEALSSLDILSVLMRQFLVSQSRVFYKQIFGILSNFVPPPTTTTTHENKKLNTPISRIPSYRAQIVQRSLIWPFTGGSLQRKNACTTTPRKVDVLGANLAFRCRCLANFFQCRGALFGMKYTHNISQTLIPDTTHTQYLPAHRFRGTPKHSISKSIGCR